MQYYKELRALNYTGEGTLYIAKNKVSGLEDSYASKSVRDNMIQIGTHVSPRDEKIPSKKGEIIRNIALILIEQNKIKEKNLIHINLKLKKYFLNTIALKEDHKKALVYSLMKIETVFSI